MVGSEALVVFLLCGFILLLIVISSWWRRRKLAKEMEESSLSRVYETVVEGQRAFRVATVSQHRGGQLTLDVYEIRLPRASDPNGMPTIRLLPPPLPPRNRSLSSDPQNSPPPPFSTAINMPIPSSLSNNSDSEGEVPEDSSSVITPSTPPPRYHEVMPISTISVNKVPQDNNFVVTVDPTTSTILS